MFTVSSFCTALLVYSIGVAAPGPANLTIANTTMNYGRKAGFMLVSGIISGSLFWGIITVLGISSILRASPDFMWWLKFVGSVYLLWMTVKSLRSACKPSQIGYRPSSRNPYLWGYYLQGLGLHLSNPKAILTWFTVTSVGLTANTPQYESYLLMATCGLLGGMIFSLYALIFASRVTQQYLTRYRRQFDAICAGFYLLVALGFLISL